MRSVFRLLLAFVLSLTAIYVLPSCKKNTELSSYDLQIRYEEGKIDGKLVYKLVNPYKTVFNHVVFNLHANAYKKGAKRRPTTTTGEAKAYPNGISYGQIDVQGVRVKGASAKYQIYGDDGEFLKVFFDGIKRGKSVEIEIDFITKIPNSALRLGENKTAVNLADFFPVACKLQDGRFLEIPYSSVGDPFFSDLHNYKVTITVPSEYTVSSSGCPTLTNVDGANTTYSYELKNGRDFAFALSKNYQVAAKTSGNVLYTYYGFGEDIEEMLNVAIDAVNFFSKAFGNYQYKSLSFAECQLAFGGMEYTGLCFIDYSLTKEEKINVLVHETAHQWWHSAVANNQSVTAYLDEGLAEYSTYLYLKARKAAAEANNMINSAKLAYKSFFSVEQTLSGNVNTVMERELSTFKNEFEYSNIAYNKSLIMFYEYGKAIGEERAIKNLSNLYGDNIGGEISLNKLIKALGYGEHFKSYVLGNVLI